MLLLYACCWLFFFAWLYLHHQLHCFLVVPDGAFHGKCHGGVFCVSGISVGYTRGCLGQLVKFVLLLSPRPHSWFDPIFFVLSRQVHLDLVYSAVSQFSLSCP